MKVCRFLALALFAITMSFTACGDDESSSGVAPESAGEISTNIVFCKIQPVHRLQEQFFCNIEQLGNVVEFFVIESLY